jgi:hypothetical protein
MSDDLIARLRRHAEGRIWSEDLYDEAADALQAAREVRDGFEVAAEMWQRNAEHLQAAVDRYRRALEFYAAEESWDALDFTPVIGHRWDSWCYGGEVARWALEGERPIRVDFEGNRP